ncbi:hypothetical protein [Marinilactibacillus psychrotolerans]|uniref:Uncharacterized protein n=1 Tax=Marinilactibacillus psychrotolerans TaxID=191770 RepID=A0AAV3WRE4_9LACT|nr:hypothetical protein [Marinilactibacillus psychrotolerans]GEL67982.1 hypothetical protein MPS01_21370 [Marinilactibacillus psychrotolerans]GEQ35690.1 hypothetical protein M132T_11980 [Marinilactibacillus psychrotolerans]SDD29761.1 hypothetical protein SAMN04488013_12425 [Marinilactibacillus psychrotolerans]
MGTNIEVFTQLRPVFYIVLGFLVLFLILSLIPRGRDSKINMFLILMISITHLVFASSLLVIENWFLEEFSLKGDSISFYIYLAILGLSILNPIAFFLRNKKKRRNSYNFR